MAVRSIAEEVQLRNSAAKPNARNCRFITPPFRLEAAAGRDAVGAAITLLQIR